MCLIHVQCDVHVPVSGTHHTGVPRGAILTRFQFVALLRTLRSLARQPKVPDPAGRWRCPSRRGHDFVLPLALDHVPPRFWVSRGKSRARQIRPLHRAPCDQIPGGRAFIDVVRALEHRAPTSRTSGLHKGRGLCQVLSFSAMMKASPTSWRVIFAESAGAPIARSSAALTGSAINRVIIFTTPHHQPYA